VLKAVDEAINKFKSGEFKQLINNGIAKRHSQRPIR
jgi:hypothetical protein